MHRVQIHPAIFNRLREISHATGITISAMVNEALASRAGLEGLPLDDDAVFGKPMEPKNISGSKGEPR